MATYQTDAIVLKREDVFEADRAYHLYTKEFGRVRAIAGSVRKINAKLTGHLEPFGLIWVELIARKNGDLFITTALSEMNFLAQNASRNQIPLFAKMSQFTVGMLKGQEKDATMWDFILSGFFAAQKIEPGHNDEFLEEYKSGLVKLMGFGSNFQEAEYYISDFNCDIM